MNVRSLFALGAVFLMIQPAMAETVKVEVEGHGLDMAMLKPGVHRYMRYLIKDGAREVKDIWTRRVSYENKDGRKLLHMVMRWDELGPPAYSLVQDSWFDAETFRPLTHSRRSDKDGEVKLKVYRFQPDAIVGETGIAGNLAQDYRSPTAEPMYNFEYDMELLQTLPMREGAEFSLPFADPGLGEPNRYVFKVAGSDSLTGTDGRPVDCWVVTADYNTGKVRARFWFDKKTQLMLHEEAIASDDGQQILIKTLLSEEQADRAT